MRRSVLTAVLATAFSFVACSEQPTEVTAPPNAPVAPSANRVAGCPTTPTAAQILDLVNSLVPPGTIRNNITKQVNKLPAKKEDRLKTAIREQIFPIQDAILKAFYAGVLVGGTSATTFDKVLDLIEALYCYVGLIPPEFPASTAGVDVIVGVVFPTSPTTTLAVPSEQAAVTIPNGAAPSATTIVITKLPDSPGPLRTSLDQYPFFYHFSGTTATGPVVFNLDVIAGICLKDEHPEVPEQNFRLAHNVAPLGFGDVEVLPRPSGSVPGIDCTDLGGGEIGVRAAGKGRFAWVQKLLLPAELHAASVTLETVGVGGTTKKFSEFGIVDIFSNPGSFSPVGPLSATETGGSTVTRTVLVTSDNGTAVNQVPVTFATDDGTLVGGSPQTILTGEDGQASVSWTLPPETGTYTLTAAVAQEDNPPFDTGDPPSTNIASIPDVDFDPASLTFTAADEPITLNVTAVEKLPGGTQHFFVTSGGAGPYIWSVNGVDGGTATYGQVVTNADFSADYTAPAAVPTPATFDVCARRQANPSNQACASVTIQPIPTSGADVIVINDLNVFDNTYGATNPNNREFWRRLAAFTGTGPRGMQTGVLFDVSRQPLCVGYCSINGNYSVIRSTYQTGGFSVIETGSSYPITSVPENIKLLFLVTPRLAFSNDEINVLKQFAGEGGRIVYIGEFEGYFSPADFAVENGFLEKMGAVMRNVGGNYACIAQLAQSSIRPHELTNGLTSFQMACASEVQLGPNDYGLFLDPSGTRALGAVAKVDLTRLLASSGSVASRLTASFSTTVENSMTTGKTTIEMGVDPALVPDLPSP